jgi:hypothetical protein
MRIGLSQIRTSDCLTIIKKPPVFGMKMEVICRISISKEMSVHAIYRR